MKEALVLPHSLLTVHPPPDRRLITTQAPEPASSGEWVTTGEVAVEVELTPKIKNLDQ